jgi:hypothetical protein
MNPFHLSILFFTAFSPLYLFSQSYILFYKETKERVPFAKIFFDNNSKTISNIARVFYLDKDAYSFIVSHPLYLKDTFKIGATAFWLTPKYQDLDEVTAKNIDYYEVYREKLKKNRKNEYPDTVYGESTRFRQFLTADNNDTCSCMEQLKTVGLKNGGNTIFLKSSTRVGHLVQRWKIFLYDQLSI